MLHVHRAERADALAEALAALLAEPLPEPFAGEVVAVPAKGVERWLAHRLAHRLGAGARGDGVCAHVAFPAPAQVVAEAVAAATGTDPAEDPWSPARAVWPLLEVVDAAAGEAWCAPLARHLGGAGGAGEPDVRRGRRYAAAHRLTELFASYALHRPGLLAAWAAGDDTGTPADLRWQPELYRRLRDRLDGPDPAERLAAAVAALGGRPGCVALPQRLSLFGPTRLPAAHLDVLAALAVGREVHLWLPHPSPSLWAAVAALVGPPPQGTGPAPPGAASGPPPRRAADPSVGAAHHPLLASLGRDVRELQVRLAARPAREHHHPAPPPRATLLGRIQADLRADRPPAGDHALAADDRSVQVHACHGAHRQVEVLREVVVGLLAADPTLEPRDVLVMCPDVETFAPLVSACFGLATGADGHPGQRLAVRLADRALRQVNPVLDVLGRLLELAGSRLTAGEVLDLLATEPVRRRFHLDEDDLTRLGELVVRAGVRWGLDAAHRGPYRLDAFPQNTWAAGLDRILLGVAMDGDDRHHLGTALPLEDVDSADVDRVGRLAEFVDRLGATLAALAGTHPLTAWIAALTEGLDLLTATTPAGAWQGAQARAELTAAARDAGPHADDVPLRLADVRGLLAGRLRGRPSRANFRTGSLTVATLVPMRSVPHRVICLLGLDDAAFPRAGIPDGDDVLARDPLLGERDPRSEDRQLLLDAVCAATEHLVVVHTGADERTGARRAPAVPLGELLDTIAATAGADALDRVVVSHPLQPFDPRNFTAGALGGPGPFSFDTAELAGARAAARPRPAPPPFLPGPLPPPEEPTVELEALARFVEHPVREFLRQRVGVSSWSDDEAPADALPVALDALQRWGVGDRLLRDRLAGHGLEQCRQAEWRRGELPPGALGHTVLTEVLAEVEELVTAAGAHLAGEPESLDVDVALPGGLRVVGTVGRVHGTTVVRAEFSRLKAKQRLRAWVQLLAVAAGHPGRPWRAVTVGRGHSGASTAVAGPLEAAAAHAALADVVALYRAGLCEPLPLPTEAALAYARTRAGSGDPEAALAQAAAVWCGGSYPEHADAPYERVFGPAAGPGVLRTGPGRREPTRFGELARTLWAPLLAAEVLA